MNFPSSIFKAYDIRGLVDGELSEDLFYCVGRAAIVHTGATDVFVGYDMRPSSRPFADALIRGITDQGANVVDIGLISTPMLNILTMMEANAQLGVMITASHNP
ncbi:MAG: phosphomannomutase, partial [Candidatus Magasanikbacteria bacterium]|nr:phosphomannomutase [Candidatus Magasanikbacteria bacterium]